VAVTLEKLDRVPWKQLFKEGVSPVAANYAALTPPPPQKKVRACVRVDTTTNDTTNDTTHACCALFSADTADLTNGAFRGRCVSPSWWWCTTMTRRRRPS